MSSIKMIFAYDHSKFNAFDLHSFPRLESSICFPISVLSEEVCMTPRHATDKKSLRKQCIFPRIEYQTNQFANAEGHLATPMA